MDTGNCSSLTEFIFLGITDNTKTKVILFTMFLLVYLVTLLANLGMITLIRMDPQLHTPMYFFLSHLSFVDFCYSSIIAPKTMANFMVEDRIISFIVCIIQFFFFCTFVMTESFLLGVMAYDCFVAI